ncbi:hypothetical protein B0H17DRAFT_1259685 [Mycena rosella]|uniref:Uncharacterized protein n=1 Tax=Mycena rosella TaxID=1033263 RepID=A0AAD7G2J1_MYCRO|nr:hypothetical protein B0H17DRAFT_1259685 [Mycena rosella]
MSTDSQSEAIHSGLESICECATHIKDSPISPLPLSADLLGALFPPLSAFTPAQNSALLDILRGPAWASEAQRRARLNLEILSWRAASAPRVPARSIPRCSRTSPWADGPREPQDPGRHDLPDHRVLPGGVQAPPARRGTPLSRAPRHRTPHKLLGLFEGFGVDFGDPDTDALAWLFVELPEADAVSADWLHRLLQDADARKLARFGLKATDDYVEELRRPTRRAPGAAQIRGSVNREIHQQKMSGGSLCQQVHTEHEGRCAQATLHFAVPGPEEKRAKSDEDGRFTK